MARHGNYNFLNYNSKEGACYDKTHIKWGETKEPGESDKKIH